MNFGNALRRLSLRSVSSLWSFNRQSINSNHAGLRIVFLLLFPFAGNAHCIAVVMGTLSASQVGSFADRNAAIGGPAPDSNERIDLGKFLKDCKPTLTAENRLVAAEIIRFASC